MTGTRSVLAECLVGDALAQLIDKLPPGEAAALAAAIPALRHLRDLDDEQRDPDGRAPG